MILPIVTGYFMMSEQVYRCLAGKAGADRRGAVSISKNLSDPPLEYLVPVLTLGLNVLGMAWWLTFYPGMAILITVLAYNLQSGRIRNAIYQRLRQ